MAAVRQPAGALDRTIPPMAGTVRTHPITSFLK
jgi:hypothetical protein